MKVSLPVASIVVEVSCVPSPFLFEESISIDRAIVVIAVGSVTQLGLLSWGGLFSTMMRRDSVVASYWSLRLEASLCHGVAI